MLHAGLRGFEVAGSGVWQSRLARLQRAGKRMYRPRPREVVGGWTIGFYTHNFWFSDLGIWVKMVSVPFAQTEGQPFSVRGCTSRDIFTRISMSA